MNMIALLPNNMSKNWLTVFDHVPIYLKQIVVSQNPNLARNTRDRNEQTGIANS